MLPHVPEEFFSSKNFSVPKKIYDYDNNNNNNNKNNNKTLLQSM